MRFWYLGLGIVLAGCTVNVVPVAAPSTPTTSPGSVQASGAPSPAASPTPVAAPAILTKVAEYDELPYYPMSYAFDSHGDAWLDCEGAMMEVLPGQAPQLRFSSSAGMLGTLYITEGDQLWQTVSTEGVQKLSPTGEVLHVFEGPSSDWSAQPFTVDREGHVWVGHDFGSKIFRYAADGTKLQDLDVGALRGLFLDSKGNVVAGSGGAVTWLSADGVQLRQFKLGDNFSAFALDSKDEVWAIEQDEQGSVYHLHADGSVETFHPAGARLLGNLVVSRDDSVWVIDNTRRVYRMDPSGKVLGSQDMGDGFQNLAADPTGYIWAGYEHQKSEREFVGSAIKFAMQ